MNVKPVASVCRFWTFWNLEMLETTSMIFTFLIVCYCLYFEQKRPSPSTPKLPEDFVKKQRAYFADIDAFELEEEEVSETDLE